jgi:AcrR family transcriptional regulator
MKSESKRPRGRPQSFEMAHVLDAAVLEFWSNGYEGTSLDNLTKAMGINRPSLYAKFGNKHGLFLAAIDRYIETISAPQSIPLAQEPDVKAAVAGYFREIILSVTGPNRPAGCLIASVACEIAGRDADVRDRVAALLDQAEKFIDTRLEAAGYGKDNDTGTATVTGAMVVAAGLGFAPRARLGATNNKLNEIADGFVQRFFDDR